MTRCCLCGEEINGFGNNAEPLTEGRCCDRCNQNVTTFRMCVTHEKIKKEYPDYSNKQVEKLYNDLRMGFRHKCLMGELV